MKPGSFDGFILKYAPLAILPMPSSEIRLGTEYCIDEKIGIGLELGYVVHFLNVEGYNSGNGFALHPEARYYLGHGRNARFYTGLQGLYRQENYGRGDVEVLDGVTRYRYTETSASKQAYGAAAQGGMVISTGPHFRLEFGAAIGLKNVNYDRSGLTTTKLYTGKSGNQAPGENYVADHKTLPYVTLDFKICLRTTQQ